MQVSEKITIDAARHAVWQVITDIDNAVRRISAIEDIEVLERPDNGVVGLKWRETRTMFGKSATETMWITSAVDNDYYETEARSHGAIYRSRLDLTERDGGTELAMSFGGEAQTFGAKIMSALMGFMVKGAMVKAIRQDLEDLKIAVENGAKTPSGTAD